MGVYVNRTCVNCSIKRPAYYMKQVTVEEVSGRSGASVSVSPFAGKGKLAKSIRLHSGRTYKRNRKVWVCMTEEACHNPNYFIELEKAQKKEREYLEYAAFLLSRTPTYIEEKKFLDKFTISPSISRKFEDLKNILNPLVDKWLSYRTNNKKLPHECKDIEKNDFRILDMNAQDFFEVLKKGLSINKENLKAEYSNKSLNDTFLNMSPFKQVALAFPIGMTLLLSAFSFFFPEILLTLGAPETILTEKFGTFHLSFIFILLSFSLFGGYMHYQVSKPLEVEFANDKIDVTRVENIFKIIEEAIVEEYKEYYRNCVLSYLIPKQSLLDFPSLPNGKEKAEHRLRFIKAMVPELVSDFDKTNESYMKFCDHISNPNPQKNSKKQKTSDSEPSNYNKENKGEKNFFETRVTEYKSDNQPKEDKKPRKWTKKDYIRAYNEDIFDEMVTVILCLKLAAADGETTDAENKFIQDLPNLDNILKIMLNYPQGKYEVKPFCQLLKKKLNEDELINIINNLFFMAEADGDISSKEVALIEEFAGLMGVDKEKFKLIKDNKLEEHIANKKETMGIDDPIMDDFSDIDFDED